ncbi:hypothetical protein SADUNF_Sadunf16G0305300 [Salix dunnii]|uniref:Uncharacterized protein n=1 Tax=Salix dunnii TaxID=1413687 RepID=A0A835JD17_9ROSI|nr:hypothetical protein SADUNF_Sadunf16G0305300 [Salix dunnii]
MYLSSNGFTIRITEGFELISSLLDYIYENYFPTTKAKHVDLIVCLYMRITTIQTMAGHAKSIK